jgi:hypothetical protein
MMCYCGHCHACQQRAYIDRQREKAGLPPIRRGKKRIRLLPMQFNPFQRPREDVSGRAVARAAATRREQSDGNTFLQWAARRREEWKAERQERAKATVY